MLPRVWPGLALAVLVSACTGQSNKDSPSIMVSGTGEITVPPTVARIAILVETHAGAPALASARNGVQVDGLLKALGRRPGLDSVRITSVSVSPNQGENGRLVDYQATTAIGFLVRQLDSVGVALQQAVESGATSVDRIAFESDSSRPAYHQALALALDRARKDAEALAAASGQRLDRLLSITSAQPWSYSAAFEEASITTGGSNAEFGNAQSGVIRLGPTPHAIRVSATVTGRWLTVLQ